MADKQQIAELLEKNKRDVVRHLQDSQSGIMLTGRIKDGKLEIDQNTLDEIAERFPKADMSFVAVNSPFDPNSQSL